MREAQRHQDHLPIKEAPDNVDGLFPSAKRQGHPYFSSSFQQLLDEKSHSRLSQGNTLKILINEQSHQERVKLIGEAKKSVYVMTHHIMNDEHGYEFTNAMIGAKRRGLDVRLIVEGGIPHGSFGSTCRRRLVKAGIPIARTPNFRSTWAMDLRIHDKILVIDGQIAITGGQNVGSFWAKGDGFNGYFRDTDVRVEGPVVIDMAWRLVNMWHQIKPGSGDVPLQRYEAELAKIEKSFTDKGYIGHEKYDQWLASAAPGMCRFVSQDPHQNNIDLLSTYTLLTKNAQRHIIFHVPSLNGVGDVPREELMGALRKAAASKTRVDVVTNGPGFTRNDMLSPLWGSMFARYTLGDVFDSVDGSDVNVHIYRAWIHSKVFMFDNFLVAVGGLNFDETSTRWTESALLCMDDSLVAAAKRMFAKDLANSKLMPH
jgi:cardiolipin synthase